MTKPRYGLENKFKKKVNGTLVKSLMLPFGYSEEKEMKNLFT